MNWGLLFTTVFSALLLFASAVSVVIARHENRQAFVAYQEEIRLKDELHLEWTQLQLEQATWGAHARIEQAAREQLNMRIPAKEQMRFLEID